MKKLSFAMAFVLDTFTYVFIYLFIAFIRVFNKKYAVCRWNLFYFSLENNNNKITVMVIEGIEHTVKSYFW